jgi:hypothetical protein
MMRNAASSVTAISGPDHTQIRWLNELVGTGLTSGSKSAGAAVTNDVRLLTLTVAITKEWQ